MHSGVQLRIISREVYICISANNWQCICGVVLQGNSHEDPRPWRRKILKDADANVSGIEAIHNVPNDKKQGRDASVKVRSKKGLVK